MADDPQAPDPVAMALAAGPGPAPDVSQGSAATPTLAAPLDPLTVGYGGGAPNIQGPAATPQLSPQGSRLPGIAGYIADLLKPPMQAQPGQMARPESRTQVSENFLSSFLQALGQGFANEGRGPGSFGRGFGAAMQAPMVQAQQQSALAAQQAQTQLTQAQANAMPAELQAKIQAFSQQPRFDPTTRQYVGNMTDAQFQQYIRGGSAAATHEQGKRFMYVPGAGLVDKQAQGGPQVVVANKNGGVPITDDLAKQYAIPYDFVGQNIDLKTLATLEKLGPTTQTKFTRDPVTGLVTTSTTTTTRGGGTPSGFPRGGNPPSGSPGSTGGGKPTKWDPSSIPVQLVEGQLDPAQLAKRGSTYSYYLEQADKYSREKYGQPFDAGQASIDYNYARNPQTQNTLRMINGMTEKGGAIEIAQNAAKSLPQFDSQTVNRVFNAFETEFGSKSATSFHTAMLGLADEYSKVMGGGVSSDTGRQQALDILKAAYSKGQLGGAVDIMQKDLSARKSALIGGNRYLQKQFGAASGNAAIDALVTKYGR